MFFVPTLFEVLFKSKPGVLLIIQNHIFATNRSRYMKDIIQIY